VVACEARDHRIYERPDFPTAAAVAEGIHGGWYLIRDSCRSRIPRRTWSGGLPLRVRPPATLRVAIRRRRFGAFGVSPRAKNRRRWLPSAAGFTT